MNSSQYEEMFYKAIVDPAKYDESENVAYNIRMNRAQYVNVQAKTQIPWFVVAVLHSMESNLNFNCNLVNGDPLSARTVHVPRGRPYGGEPPFSWEYAAIDALTKGDLWIPSITSNWTISQVLEFLERYNGLGYAERDLNTPYLWSGTNLYTKGLFVADDKFDPEAVSKQIGSVVIIKTMLNKGYIQLIKGDFL